MVFVVFYQKGYIHVGFGGDVYISDVPVDNSSGIGSEAEGKLNAIDSVVSEGFILETLTMKRLLIAYAEDI